MSDPKRFYHVVGATKYDKNTSNWIPDPDAVWPIPEDMRKWLHNHLPHEAFALVLEYYDMEEVLPEDPNIHALRWRYKSSPKPRSSP